MAAAMLALGVAVGAAIGPAPAPSLASSAQSRFLASTLIPLIARTSAAKRAAAAALSTPPSASLTPSGASAHPTPKASHRLPLTRRSPTPTPKPSATSETPEASSPSATEPGSSTPGKTPSKPKQEPKTPTKPPPITHVWLIVLDQQSFTNVLSQRAAAPYLTKQLLPQGTLLSGYSLVAHSELANDVALLSGQSPNTDTEQNCPTYNEVQPPTIDAASGLASGVGCVYPKATQTLADELTTGGLTWKAYVEGMNEAAPAAGAPTAAASPSGAPATTCRHPALGAADPSQAPGHAYQGFRNPFVYFDSLLEGGACTADDVDASELATDLTAPSGPPNLSWIVPSACHDGSPTPCSAGAPAGLAGADAFLKQTLPAILKSSAYRSDGLVLITSDAAPAAAASSKSTAGSKSASGSNPPKPVGALLLSPYVRANARVPGAYNQLSILASLERLFGIPLLGHAADASVKQFGGDVYLTTKKAA
jgi:hypothetical protein